MKRVLTKLTGGTVLLALLCAVLCCTVFAANPFTDVERGDNYYNAVMWALNNGVTTGTTASTFSPYSTCNRGQVVTFLWRAAGEPEPAAQNNLFTDVSSGSYCYKAVMWAIQRGITNGTSAAAFSPSNPCTYAHVLTFLWRSVGSPAPSGYSWYAADYANLWYTDALAWAETSGILSSFDAEPGNPCPRASIVSYLYRWAAPGSVLSLFPELKADKAEIPLEDLPDTYRYGDVEFILEKQEGEFGLIPMFSVEFLEIDFPGPALERVTTNIYESTDDNGDKFTVGFSRANGTVYLDFYRNGVHMGMVPPEGSNIAVTYTLSDYLGVYEAPEGTYPIASIESLGGNKCRISISMKYAAWNADGEFDAEDGCIYYQDGTYSERDKGEDFTVVDSGYAGSLYFKSPGVLGWYDPNVGEGEESFFVRAAWSDD